MGSVRIGADLTGILSLSTQPSSGGLGERGHVHGCGSEAKEETLLWQRLSRVSHRIEPVPAL